MRNVIDKRYKILIVGFGFMGQTHAGNVLSHPGATLCGIVDPGTPEVLLDKVHGNKTTIHISKSDIIDIPHYKDLDTALTHVHPDAVIICLPTKLHCEGVLLSLNNNCHVLVEKPLSVDLSECSKMCLAAEKAGKILAVGHCVRYNSYYAYLRDSIRNERLGKPVFLSFKRFAGIPTWGAWKDVTMANASGGALFDLLSHDFDFIRFSFGEPMELDINRNIQKQFGNNQVQVLLKYNNFNIEVEGGFVHLSKFPLTRTFTACFEQGAITLENNGRCQEITEDSLKEVMLKENNIYYEELDDFIFTMNGHSPRELCSGDDASKTVELCHKLKI